MNNRSSFSPFKSSAIRLSPRARMGFGFDLPDIRIPDFSLPSGLPPAPPPAAPPAPPPAAPPAPPAPGMEEPLAPQWQDQAYFYPESRLPQERTYPNEPVMPPAPASAPDSSSGVNTNLLVGGAIVVALVAILS